jgi:Na+/H+-dicarboxylate symporter
MCRTALNVTGDAAVATSVASMEGQLNLELEKPAVEV